MRLMKMMGTIVIGGLLTGCQGSNAGGSKSTASGSAIGSADEQTAAELQRTYRASHPGMQVGYVNAVDPERRIVSVSGISPELVRRGAIMSILTNGGTLEAVVYGGSGNNVHLRYEPLRPGETAPATGELAVWNPGGPAVIPEAVPPAVPTPTPTGTTGTENTPPPAVAPDRLAPAPVTPPPTPTTAPSDAVPPATQPLTDIQPPAARPAEIPASTETPAPPPTTMPASRPVIDINK